MFKARLNTDFSQGHVQRTENKLDLALGDEGFFKVSTPDGIRYTRDGNFTLNNQGVLINQEGFPVQGNNGEVSINGENIQINKAGDITVDGVAVDTLSVVTFEDLNKLEKQGADLFVYTGDAEVDEQEPELFSVNQGALEGSNVQVVDEMVTMIDHHRMYETFQKMMMTFDEVDGKAITEVGKPG